MRPGPSDLVDENEFNELPGLPITSRSHQPRRVRFSLSFRDVEELLAKRGITVTHETIRQWCRKFGPEYARKLNRRQGRLGEIWHLDEVFLKIGGERHYLWRAVDQDGDVIDILVQRYRGSW